VVKLAAPETPVTFGLHDPAATELLAVSVSTLVAAVGFGLNDAVTPLGRPAMDRVTAPFPPAMRVTVQPDVLVLPGDVVISRGPVRLKGWPTFTTSLTVWTVEPELPVMVAKYVPTLAEPLAVSVSTLAVAVVAGLNDAVISGGRPEAEKVTAPENPEESCTVMTLVVEPP
jgi:hypothetical protein